MNEFTTPIVVPSSPTNGAVAPTVASTARPRFRFVSSRSMLRSTARSAELMSPTVRSRWPTSTRRSARSSATCCSSHEPEARPGGARHGGRHRAVRRTARHDDGHRERLHGHGRAGSGGLAAIGAGIAEALITTAFGLLVAIPAVWAYNYFTTKIDNLTAEMTYVSGNDRLPHQGRSGQFGRSRFTREFNAAGAPARARQ